MDQDMRVWRVYKCGHIQFATKPPRAGIGLLATYASGKHSRAPSAWVSSSLCKLTGLEDVIAACNYIFLLLTLFPTLIANCTSSLSEISLSDLWKFMRQNWPNQGRIWVKVVLNSSKVVLKFGQSYVVVQAKLCHSTSKNVKFEQFSFFFFFFAKFALK